MKNATDKILERVDVLGKAITDAISKMGPEAQYAFNETLQAFSLQYMIKVISVGSLTLLSWAVCAVLYKLGWVYLGKEHTKDDDTYVNYFIWSGITGVWSVCWSFIFILNMGAWITAWLHPMGALILGKIQ